MLSTSDVATRLGVSSSVIAGYISKHPELRPQGRLGRYLIWTEEEVEILEKSNIGKIKRSRNCPGCGEGGLERFLSSREKGPSKCLPCIAKERGFVLRKAPAARKSKKQKS